MRFKLIFIIINYLLILTLVTSIKCIAKESEKNLFTLDESISLALSEFSSIKVRKESIIKANMVKKKAMASFLPVLSTSYGYRYLNEPHRIKNIELGAPFPIIPKMLLNTEQNYQWKTTIKQPVFAGFALSSAYKLSKAGIDISKLELELEKLYIALKVNESYFGILKAQKTLDVAKSALIQLKKHVNQTRNFFETGIIPKNDLLKAEVELSNTQYNLTKAKNAKKIARLAFNILLSRPVNASVDVFDILIYKPIKFDFETCFTKALNQRPDIKILNAKLKQTELMIKIARSSYYPQIGIRADYIKEGDKSDVSGSDYHLPESWQFAAEASWTLWEWGKTSFEVNEKKSEKQQLKYIISELKNSISLQVNQAILTLENTAKNIATTEKGVSQAKENLRSSHDRYNNNLTTSTEVLDAQTLLTQAKLNYYSSLYNYNLAIAQLDHAMGNHFQSPEK